MTSPLLGIDLGQRRTGVALSLTGFLSSPLTTIEHNPPHLHSLFEHLTKIIKEHEVVTIVVGDPRSADGSENEQTKWVNTAVNQLSHHLEKTISWPLSFERVDEYHSSLDAADLFPGVDKDSAAAALILQDYLESHES